MPINKEALLRYRIIDRSLRRKNQPYTALKEIQEFCLHELGTNVSERTLKEDIHRMRYDEQLGYCAPIVYSNNHRGYCYSDPNYAINQLPVHEEDMLAVRFAIGLLDKFKELPMLTHFAGLVDKLNEAVKIDRLKQYKHQTVVSPEYSPTLKGIECMEPLIKCISENNGISMQYQAFGSGSSKNYTLHPYLLREFRNRWYLLAWDEYSNKIKTFGLDRIIHLELLDKSFAIHESFDPVSYFKFSYGITYSEKKPQQVQLRFIDNAIHYVRSKPLHQSQTVLKDKTEVFEISLEVQLSYELISDILSFGKSCIVLETNDLKYLIKEEIRKMSKNY